MGSDIHGFLEVNTNGNWKIVENIPDNRNYDIFGLLFGVRNYVNAEPIADRRGIPKYYSEDERRERIDDVDDFWEMDGHSHSYLTAGDINDYDFSQEFADSRGTWFKDGMNMGGKSGGNLDGRIPKDTETVKHLKISAQEILDNSHSWKEFFEKMVWMGNEYGYENVRIVVWFDS